MLAPSFRSRAAARVAALAAFVLPLLSGCGATAIPAGTLRLPLYGNVGQPDPAQAAIPGFLDELLYSGLVKFGPDLHVIPELAVSIPTISSDGRTYTFTIRQDARFTDGRHVTAKDVKYSLTRALSPSVDSTVARRYLGGIEGAPSVESGRASTLNGVRAVNRLTVRIRLTRPDAEFLDKLAAPCASVVDRKVVSWQPIRDWLRRPAGTGPFEIAGRLRNGQLRLVPRGHFYGSPLQVKSLILVPISSTARELDLYRKSQIDVAELPSAHLSAYANRADFHLARGLIGYYALPDGRLGESLAAAVDRTRLLPSPSTNLIPLNSLVPVAVPDYVSSPPNLVPTASDPDIRLVSSDPHDPVMTQLVANLTKQWNISRTGALVRVVRASYLLPSPGLWLHVVLAQTSSTWFRSILAQASRLTNDPVTRMSLYSEAESWALGKGLVIPLAEENVGYLIKPAVGNLQATPLGIMPQNNTWSTVSVSR